MTIAESRIFCGICFDLVMEMQFTPTAWLQMKQLLRQHGTSKWISKGVRSHHGRESMSPRESSSQVMSQSADLWEMGKACQCLKKAKC